jgi:chromosome transmission fidelity protein 18
MKQLTALRLAVCYQKAKVRFVLVVLLSSKMNAIAEDFPDVSELINQRPKETSALAVEASRSSDLLPPALFYRSSLRATTFDGKTVHMKRKTRIDGMPRNVRAYQGPRAYLGFISSQKSATAGRPMGNLLDVPIHRLIDELSAETAAKLDRPYVSPPYIHCTRHQLTHSSA